MVFDDKATADTALSRLTAGEDFAAVAADMLNWTEADTDLGTVTKSALDPALADVAFATALARLPALLRQPLASIFWSLTRLPKAARPSLMM